MSEEHAVSSVDRRIRSSHEVGDKERGADRYQWVDQGHSAVEVPESQSDGDEEHMLDLFRLVVEERSVHYG